MPSTPDSLLRLELQATGENVTTWGIKTNNNIELLGQAIAGAANVNVGGSGNYTLAANNYTTDEARAATLVLTGTLSGNRDVIVPTSPKHYTIINQTAGAFPLTIRQVSGTGVAIPAGSSQIVCTSTTCVGVGINEVSRTGDTMTGALGFAVGSSTTPGLFPAGDTNTGFFQAAAAPDTLSISVGGTEVARFGTGGFMRLAAGTTAAPAYSFSGDTDTGIYSTGAGIVGLTHNGVKGYEFFLNNLLMDISPGTTSGNFYFRAGDASATNARIGIFATLNENNITVADVRHNVATDGSGSINFYATPAGDRTADRRVLRATIPGSGAITMVGPVDVTSGNLNVTTGQLQVGGNPVTIQRDTEKTATGVNVDFTTIPAGVRRVTALLSGVSTNSNSNLLLQLGASGSVEVTGYAGSARAEGLGSSSLTTGVPVFVGVSSGQTYSGRITCELIASNIWIITGLVGSATGQTVSYCGYTKTLAAVLDRLRITTVNGTDTFDAGTINVLWEF